MGIKYAKQIMFYITSLDCRADSHCKTQLCSTCISSKARHSLLSLFNTSVDLGCTVCLSMLLMHGGDLHFHYNRATCLKVCLYWSKV